MEFYLKPVASGAIRYCRFKTTTSIRPCTMISCENCETIFGKAPHNILRCRLTVYGEGHYIIFNINKFCFVTHSNLFYIWECNS